MKIQSNENLTLVIMAAGIGSRYGGLKQIEPLGPNGEVIIDYSVFDAVRAGFKKVVAIIRKDIEVDFRQFIGKRLERNLDVEYVFQEVNALPAGFVVPATRTKPWGTTQAILAAQSAVGGNFAVINADDFYGAGAFSVLAQYTQACSGDSNPVAAINVGYLIENTLSEFGSVTRGVCETGNDGLLQKIAERKKVQKFPDGIKYAADDAAWVTISSSTLASMNMWGFSPAIFGLLRDKFESFLKKQGSEVSSESILPTEIGTLIDENKVAVKMVQTDEKWFGVTYKEDKEFVADTIKKLVENGTYPHKLWTK